MKGALLHKEILAHFCIAGPGNIRRHEKDGFACKLFQQRCPELQLGWIETKSGIQIFHRGRYLKIKEAASKTPIEALCLENADINRENVVTVLQFISKYNLQIAYPNL